MFPRGVERSKFNISELKPKTSNTCDEIPEKQHDLQTQQAVCDMFHKTDMKSSKPIWDLK